jgi:hypothetical protein
MRVGCVGLFHLEKRRRCVGSSGGSLVDGMQTAQVINPSTPKWMGEKGSALWVNFLIFLKMNITFHVFINPGHTFIN